MILELKIQFLFLFFGGRIKNEKFQFIRLSNNQSIWAFAGSGNFASPSDGSYLIFYPKSLRRPLTFDKHRTEMVVFPFRLEKKMNSFPLLTKMNKGIAIVFSPWYLWCEKERKWRSSTDVVCMFAQKLTSDTKRFLVFPLCLAKAS